MLLCSSCNKVIANVDPVNTRYGICASCPTPLKDNQSVCVECDKIINDVDTIFDEHGDPNCKKCHEKMRMKTWKLYASGTDHFETVVKAETKEEAEAKAYEVDDWDYVEDCGDWYINPLQIEEVEE